MKAYRPRKTLNSYSDLKKYNNSQQDLSSDLMCLHSTQLLRQGQTDKQADNSNKSLSILNSSFNSSTYREGRQSQFLQQSSLYDNKMKETKKKVGIQLSILEKNILRQSKNQAIAEGRKQRDKIKRINRSSINNIKKRNALNMTSQSSLIFQHTNISNGRDVHICQDLPSCSEMTSTDLQNLRKQDKQLYKLYLDLFQDYKIQLQKQKTHKQKLGLLQAGVAKEYQIQSQIKRKTQLLKQQKALLKQQYSRIQQKWLFGLRQYL